MLMRLVPIPPKPREVPPPVRSPLTLWQVFQGPPSHTSILIDDEGNVTDVQNPLNSATKDAAVFIPGGHQFVTEENSFAYNALVAAGYTFEVA